MQSTRRDFVCGMTGIMAAMYAGAEREPAQPQKIPSAIPRRPLGRTGVEVSALGLGGFHIGTQSERESIRLIRTAIDAGITFLDNCWDYNGGRSETRMGKALAGGYRNRVFLMTKIDGRTAPAAREQLEQSLQ
ncbi:MAG TPA: aldo/keto reductase, partial [Polyangiaceae bacterium]|nr:aldo/keto reductase [Polyangiaceae bacterium]